MKKYSYIVIGTAFLFSITAQAQLNLKPDAIALEVNISDTNQKPVTEELQESTDPAFRNGIFGVRFMPTVSYLKVQDVEGNAIKGDAVLSYGYGGLIGLNFNRFIGLQLEVLYSTLSQKYIDHALERQIDLNYINIPLLLSLNTNRMKVVNFNIVAGPQVGINVGSTLKTTESGNGNGNGSTNAQAVLAVKKSDFGIAYGAGLDFALNRARTIRLDLGFRGVMGLIDISDRNQTMETNSYYVLQKKETRTYAGYVGFTFLF